MSSQNPNNCVAVQYETVTLKVAYFADGTIHYANPNTGEVLFTKKTPTGKSPMVEIELPPAKQNDQTN